MKRNTNRGLGMLAVATAVLLAAGPSGTGEEEIAGIAWMTDLDRATAQAAEEGRPLLVVFR